MKRAVIHVAMPLVHDLLRLPADVEVLHVAPGNAGLTMQVVVTADNLPEMPPHGIPYELRPVYARDEDGHVTLVSLDG